MHMVERWEFVKEESRVVLLVEDVVVEEAAAVEVEEEAVWVFKSL